MEILVHNLSQTGITVTQSNQYFKPRLISPRSSGEVIFKSLRPRCQGGTIICREAESSAPICEMGAAQFECRTSNGWIMLKDKKSVRSQWKLFLYKNKEGKSVKREIYILQNRDLSSFLSEVDDNRPISDLCLPSTHDSLSLYGWPISQCQSLSTPFAVQLQSGIRVFDVRMSVVDGQLVAHHGIIPEKTPFTDVLTAINSFLTDPKTSRETIVMSMKQEDSSSPSDFSKLVHDELYNGPGGKDLWFLENRIPNLGEVRGKAILFSRFGDGTGWDNGLEGMGIHPTTWPDSQKDGFQWTLNDTLVRTSDWYDIPSFLSIPDKFSLASTNLLPPTGGYTQPTLNISFFSAASFPLALPPTVAKGFGFPEWKLGIEGMNSLLGKWLLSQLDPSSTTVPRGWVFMDFFTSTDDLAALIIECNFSEMKSEKN